MLFRLTLFATLLSSALAQALPAETWVVAFSNNKGDADEISLSYAERDAQQMVEALQTHAAIEPRRTIVVPNASANQVLETLAEVNARIRERSSKASTALVVFYSGHADAAELHLGGTRLRLDEVVNLVRGSPAAVRLLVLDACRSGSVTRVKGMKEAPEFALNVQGELAAEGMAIVTSSTAGEASQESDELRGSFFTHHLVNALRGAADENGDAKVSLAEAYTYTYAQTLRSTSRTAVLQHPTYAYDVKGKGDLILAQGAAASARLGRLRLGAAATYIVSEGRKGGPIVAEVQPMREHATLALNAGSYFVQQRFPNEFREYEAVVPTGGEVQLASLEYRSISYDLLVRKRGGGASGGGTEVPSLAQGLFVLGAVRGEALEGEGVAPHLQLGYSFDLPWFTIAARLRGSTLENDAGGTGLLRRHNELGVGFAIQRFVDFEPLSISFGVLAELVIHNQTFTEGARIAPPITSLGGMFGGLFTVERQLGRGFAIHLEGGPITLLYSQAVLRQGAASGSEFKSPFTFWVALGLVWRR